MSKFGGWLATILSAVIISYAGWYLTVGRHTTTVFEGRVYSESGPISRAEVVLQLSGRVGEGGPFHDWTDENGSYNFEAADLPGSTTGTLSISAPGYESAPGRLLARPLELDNRQDIGLTPTASARPLPGTAPFHPGKVTLPPYSRKSVAVKIPAK